MYCNRATSLVFGFGYRSSCREVGSWVPGVLLIDCVEAAPQMGAFVARYCTYTSIAQFYRRPLLYTQVLSQNPDLTF